MHGTVFTSTSHSSIDHISSLPASPSVATPFAVAPLISSVPSTPLVPQSTMRPPPFITRVASPRSSAMPELSLVVNFEEPPIAAPNPIVTKTHCMVTRSQTGSLKPKSLVAKNDDKGWEPTTYLQVAAHPYLQKAMAAKFTALVRMKHGN